MERLKWIILALLLLILVFVIFFRPAARKKNHPENYVKFRIDHTVAEGNTDIPLIKQGEYLLPLEEFQIIEGRGNGWHISFAEETEQGKLIFTFDAVDTSGGLFSSGFPVTIQHSPYTGSISAGLVQLYRGSFNVGYVKRIDNSNFQEDIIPMLDFSCTIDTAWTSDSLGGMQMAFTAQSSEFLTEALEIQYSMKGKIEINNARSSRRIIQ